MGFDPLFFRIGPESCTYPGNASLIFFADLIGIFGGMVVAKAQIFLDESYI
jgi:hypothetical protein